MSNSTAEKIGDRALRLGMVSAEQVAELVAEQQRKYQAGEPRFRLGYMMVVSGLITETQLITLLDPELSGFRLTEESIRVASKLIHAVKSDRTILCTSPEESPNTAAVAAQVALSIALMEKQPVLLIDANVGRPAVCSMFKIVGSPGLSEFVTGEVSIDETVSPSGVSGLDIMPAGTKSDGYIAQVISRRGEEAFAQITSAYRYVVIIAPPLLSSTETLVFAQRTDTSFIVATAGATKRELLRKTQAALEDAGANPLGVVLAREERKNRKNRKKVLRHEPIRVVQLIHTMAYGGVETILINWARSLPMVNIIPTMVCFDNGDDSEKPFVAAARNAGVEVRTIPWSRLKPVPKAVRALNAIIRDTDAHLVHTHNVYANIVGLISARITGSAAISTVYVWSDFGWKRNLLQKIDKLFLQHFDRVTAQCLQTQKDTIDVGIDPSNTRILKSGFDLQSYNQLSTAERAAARLEQGVGPTDLVLVNVARLYPEKAQIALLRAFRTIREQYPHTWLWIFGTGPEQELLEREAADLGIAEFVRFQGFVDDIAAWLSLADIQVHPSRAEGVPLAVCSGMAAGIPIVASNVGGISEVITHDRTGLLVPSADASDFESVFIGSVQILLDNADARTKLGSAAREFVENDYSLLSAVNDIDKVYKEILD